MDTTRRALIAGSVIAAGTAALGFPRATRAAAPDLRTAAREAWLYTLPLIELARLRRTQGPLGLRINAFNHLRGLATPAFRAVTTPNVDTLYSAAAVDLSNGPATISLPSFGQRYFSLHLMDMYTNRIAILGTRTIGGEGGTFTVVGPNAAEQSSAIRSPTVWIIALMRILVDGPDDLDAVHSLQDRLVLEAAPARQSASFATRDARWDAYFSSGHDLIVENPPPVTDMAELRLIAPLGVGTREGFGPGRFTPTDVQQIEAGIADAKRLVARIEIAPVNGWAYERANIGDFGQDYLYRAQIATYGLLALTRDEAMYMAAMAPDGTFRLNRNMMRLTFAASELPPVNGFWSLTMYEATPQGQFYLTENPIQRYAIGDRTKGLNRNSNGSLDIWISRNDPGGARTANWLPAPASGPYGLIMRTYLPKPELLDGAYRLPAVVPV